MSEMSRDQLAVSHLDAARLELGFAARVSNDVKPMALERMGYHLLASLMHLVGHPAAAAYTAQLFPAATPPDEQDAEQSGEQDGEQSGEQSGEAGAPVEAVAPPVEDKLTDRPRRGEKAS